MNNNTVIGLNDSAMEILLKMSEGNPGAATVLAELLKKDDGIIDIAWLDDLGIRGSKIWIGYKYYCNHDINKFSECVRNQDKEFIKKIEEFRNDN